MFKTPTVLACLCLLGCQSPETSREDFIGDAFPPAGHSCADLVAVMLAGSGATSTLPAAFESRPFVAPAERAETTVVSDSVPAPAEVFVPVPQHAAVTKSMLVALDTRIQVILNNIANVNTPGFKRSIVHLASTPPVPVGGGLQTTQQDQAGNAVPTGAYVGNGTQVLSIIKVYSPGTLELTERSLDLAIDGAGFFQVLLPDGNTGYTRAGHFLVNADGRIVTAAGHILQPEISLPPDVLEINIDPSGQVTGRTATSPDTTQTFGEIRLTNFMNPSGLLAMGNSILRQTDASGSPTVDGQPGTNGLGTFNQGFIERSNVQLTVELLDLYQARREYDAIMQALMATGVIGQPDADGK